MTTIQFHRHKPWAPDEEFTESVQIVLPWNEREQTIVDVLPEENEKIQYSIREYRSLDVQKPRWETQGWTVEWLALLNPPCEWADFWITATVVRGVNRRVPTAHPSQIEQVPGINLDLETAMMLTKQLNDARNEGRRTGSDHQEFKIVRARHQLTGNVIYADLFHE